MAGGLCVAGSSGLGLFVIVRRFITTRAWLMLGTILIGIAGR